MENIRLKPTVDNDLNFVLQAEQNQQNRSFVNSWTKQQHRESLSNSNIAHFIIERTTDNSPVGYAILADLMNFYQSIELRRIVITDKGKGYGRETLKLIKKLSFEELSAHRLWLDVKENNLRAKKLYESEGFTVEGRLRECLHISNTWESLIIMSILNIEYFNA
ncbi:MAG: GNAT family N-acetyltransferase [Rivularia sp. T60_A2020_040]|nr:GNAT family N-acetyltransferase [Rivularia sp. T60_A2020_040]